MAYLVNRDDSVPALSVCRSLNDTLDAFNDPGKKDRVLSDVLRFGDEAVLNAFVTSSQVLPKTHIDVQAMFQRYVDQSISKTINLPNETTVEEIKELLKYAYDSGLKGLTMFRKGCRRDAFLTKPVCPSCGGMLQHKEGCLSCRSCNWGACSTG